MTYLILAYSCIGYWHFRKTLTALQPYDSTDTALLNATLALVIGPCLLIPTLIIATFMKLDDFLWTTILKPGQDAQDRLTHEWINMIWGDSA